MTFWGAFNSNLHTLFKKITPKTGLLTRKCAFNCNFHMVRTQFKRRIVGYSMSIILIISIDDQGLICATKNQTGFLLLMWHFLVPKPKNGIFFQSMISSITICIQLWTLEIFNITWIISYLVSGKIFGFIVSGDE